MLLGIVTDVHNHHEELSRALDLFRKRDVDQVITIGDTCDAFGPADGADEVAKLLLECNAIGVWGNHDFGLCCEISDSSRKRFGSDTFDLMKQMKPHLEIEDCYFSHKESSVDAHDVEQLWSLREERSDLLTLATKAFEAVTTKQQFIGHYHRWWAATPAGPIDWNGEAPLILKPGERYFIVVAAMFQNKCAVFNTTSGLLEPLDCQPR